MEIVRVLLDSGLAPPVLRGHQLLRVHPQVAVGVAHQPDIRRLPDERAAIEHLQRSGEDQPVGEDRAFVHHAVVVRVLEHHDAADRVHVGFRCGKVGHEPGHFDDPEAALGIPIHPDRILDERLARDQLEAIPGRDRERLHRVGRGQRRRLRGHLLHAGWPGLGALVAIDGGGHDTNEHQDEAESRQEAHRVDCSSKAKRKEYGARSARCTGDRRPRS
jgi:hypothetical protein